MTKKDKGETWDSEIPIRLELTQGHYKLTIQELEWRLMKKYGREALRIVTDMGSFVTSAWDFINFLRKNKPVIGKVIAFDVVGTGTGRRFKNFQVV